MLQIPKGTSDRAARTLPENLLIKPSGISEAGLGVWTKTVIVKDTLFGPYEGEIVYNETEALQSGYSWAASISLSTS